ncbi:hypothetical protein [Mycolicibacterium peregrinum]|uniref:Uncharacterized protein n=1 Tax=Mycolicibacterium peregrinum TaxID=43304 RepID=A0A1A0W3R0_MYCPR|nr:hypothetical protein [Mycolicibacterium peregrinum]OBB90319.1 hypothetical protein A5779_26275 [Mycolicibacterium peregrinum]
MGVVHDTDDVQLAELAALIKERNSIDARLGAILNRPASIGNIGEWIAAQVFDIDLVSSGSNAAFDGHFTSGLLAGKTVNVKAYGRQEGLLDVITNPTLDYYLVMTGPKGALKSSKGGLRPFCIDSVYLFNSKDLLAALEVTGVKVGVATSVRAAQWNAAEIFPNSANPALVLTELQKSRLAMFESEKGGR